MSRFAVCSIALVVLLAFLGHARACACSGVTLNNLASGAYHCDCNYLPDVDDSYVDAAQDAIDHKWLLVAKTFGLNNPSKPFGAVLVDRETDSMVCGGWNNRSVWYDNHAESDTINRCTALYPDGPAGANNAAWANLTLYSNIEPCPMCFGKLLNRGIVRVVYGVSAETYAIRTCKGGARLTSKEYSDSTDYWQFYPGGHKVDVRGPLADLVEQLLEPFPVACQH